MLPVEIIQKKRDGKKLTKDEITQFINLLVGGKISEAQASAFLMASYLKGLSILETKHLTYAMRDSGKKFNFKNLSKPIIDKHSTGGVGDKVSLLLAPLASACGLAVPMISGRGLGFTGGTADKLESIEGFKVNLTDEKMKKNLKEVGCFIITQDETIAPADRILYSIRDVTGTIDNNGLITASILSKKMVEGLDGLVLDIKVGNGAFMSTLEKAKELGDYMMKLAKEIDLPLRITFSAMDEPLGNYIGNWLEVVEAEESLKGNCPKDLRILTENLVTSMLILGKISTNYYEALINIREVWEKGYALENFYKMIKLQEGNFENSKMLYKNTNRKDIVSNQKGYITNINAKEIGISSMILGAGRKSQYDQIDYSAGIVLNKKYGDYIEKGEILATIFGKKTDIFDLVIKRIEEAITIDDKIDENSIANKSIILEEWY